MFESGVIKNSIDNAAFLHCVEETLSKSRYKNFVKSCCIQYSIKKNLRSAASSYNILSPAIACRARMKFALFCKTILLNWIKLVYVSNTPSDLSGVKIPNYAVWLIQIIFGMKWVTVLSIWTFNIEWVVFAVNGIEWLLCYVWSAIQPREKSVE